MILLSLLITVINVLSMSSTSQSKAINGLINKSFTKFNLLFTITQTITLEKNMTLFLTVEQTSLTFKQLSTASCSPLCKIKGEQFIFKGPLELKQILISLRSHKINYSNTKFVASYKIQNQKTVVKRDNIFGKIQKQSELSNCQLNLSYELNNLGQYFKLSLLILEQVQNSHIVINFSQIGKIDELFFKQELNCSILTFNQSFNQDCQLNYDLNSLVISPKLFLHNFSLIVTGMMEKQIEGQLSKIKVTIVNDFEKIKLQCFKNQNRINPNLKVSQTPNCTLSVVLNAPNQYYFRSLQNLTATISWPQNVTNQQNYTFTFPQLYQQSYSNISSSCYISNIQNTTCNVTNYIQSQTYILTADITIPTSLTQLNQIQLIILNVNSSWQYDDPTYFQFSGCNNTVPFILTCSQPCQTCTSESSPTQCTSCYPGNFTFQNQCSNSCISTYYANITTGNCQLCVSPCDTCDNSTYCNSCLSQFYYYNNDCLVSCPAGSYPFQDSQSCQPCPQQCSVCSSNNNCTSCESPAFYYNYSCVYNCPTGTYQIGNISQCYICFGLCSQCEDASVQCTNGGCIDGFYMFDGYCLQCPLSCATCNQYQQCTSCQNVNGIILNNSKCISQCNEGQYFDGYICSACSNGCAYCINSNSCTSCLTSFYQNNGTCYSCDISCSICFSSNICLFCAEGGNWSNYVCSGCIDGYALDGNKVCVPSLTGTVIPLPFTIISLIVLLICLTSYFTKKQTIFFVMFFSLNSVVETIAAITFIALIIQDKYLQLQKYNAIMTCIFCALGFDLINKIGQIFGMYKLRNSIYYQKWLEQHKTTRIILTIASFFGLRLFYLQFSKAFGSPRLSAYLQKLQQFFLMKGVLISSLLTSILVIAGCVLQMQYPHFNSMYYAPFAISIDCLIVTILGAAALSVFLLKTDIIVQQQFININTAKSVTIEQSPRLSEMKTVQRPLQPNASQS